MQPNDIEFREFRTQNYSLFKQFAALILNCECGIWFLSQHCASAVAKTYYTINLIGQQ